jgi:hypothetical protein
MRMVNLSPFRSASNIINTCMKRGLKVTPIDSPSSSHHRRFDMTVGRNRRSDSKRRFVRILIMLAAELERRRFLPTGNNE